MADALLAATPNASPHSSTRPRRRVVFLAPHFPPSNLTAVHRTRLFLPHLPKYGYEPVVVTVDPRYYEETPDHELLACIPSECEVHRVPALPTRPIRLVGDLGIRSFLPIQRKLAQLCRAGRVDLLYIPIPPNYAALHGPLIYRRYRIPYVIDYIDPWIYPITPDERWSWRARLTHCLARWLEPPAVRHAAGITSVASTYYEPVFQRHPFLAQRPNAGIPYGAEPEDHTLAVDSGRRSTLLALPDLQGRRVIVYAGAILPRARDTLRTLLSACLRLRDRGVAHAKDLHLLFVGTGLRSDDPQSGIVTPIARELGASEFVTEVAERQFYFEVLRTLHQAFAVAILGSSERHYTASKIFQAMYSQRPIIAMLHEASSAVAMLRSVGDVHLVTFHDDRPVSECLEETTTALADLLSRSTLQPVHRDLAYLAPFTADAMAQKLARIFDDILIRTRHARSDSQVAISPPAAQVTLP